MSKQTIRFDRQAKQFRKGGRYASKSAGMRSSIAREQYYRYYPSQRPGYLPPKQRPKNATAEIKKGRVIYVIKRKRKTKIPKLPQAPVFAPEPDIGYGFEIRDLYAESEIKFDYDDLYTDYNVFDSDYWGDEFVNIDLDDEDAYGDDNV